MLVTRAVVAILATVAAPSFNTLIRGNRLVTDTNHLVTSLSLARSEAVKRAARVVVCAGTPAGCAGGWTNGWIVFTDADGGCDPDVGTDEILRVSEDLQGGNAMTAAPGASPLRR